MSALVGYKGSLFSQSGLVFVPYGVWNMQDKKFKNVLVIPRYVVNISFAEERNATIIIKRIDKGYQVIKNRNDKDKPLFKNLQEMKDWLFIQVL